MPDVHVIEIPAIGPVLFRRDRRVKRLRISVHPFDGVSVSLPARMSYREAAQFTREKVAWIQQQQLRLKEYAEKTKVVSAIRTTDELAAARQRLIERLHYLAERYGFTFNRIFIRNQKTRWGSCSFQNNISLNRNLVGLPEHLTDYVILHELAHTRIKNHSRGFWQLMDELTGDGKALANELRKYSIHNTNK